nr:hypothetical protein [Desulfuromonas sp. TF]
MARRRGKPEDEFSQVNNNEMGVLVRRSDDAELYKDAYEESQRFIRISDEVRISLERVANEPESKSEAEESSDKLTSSKLAQKLGMKTNELMEKLVTSGHFEVREGKHYLTALGKEVGGEFRMSPRFGPYFLWPENFKV